MIVDIISICLVIIILSIIILSIIDIKKNDIKIKLDCKEIEEHDSFYVDNGQGYLVENCRKNI